MFKKIIFWSEFPERNNWREISSLFNKLKLKAEIYVASKTKKEFLDWKRKVRSKYIDLGVWPVLSREEGYWFSGYCSKKSIDKLKEYKGFKIKIDLEPPFNGRYSDLKMFFYLFKFIIPKKNSKYLLEVIDEVSKKNNVLVNEFPFSRFWMKNSGCYFYNNRIEKNIIGYSTISRFKFLVRFLVKKRVKEGVKSCSVGLIGKGILGNERIYKNINEFKRNLEFFNNLGIEQIAVYSIDAIMEKEDREEWLKLLRGLG